jgi:hypothetical protein
MINTGKKVLSDYFGKTLELRQPSVFKNHYELLLEDEVIGTVKIPRLFSFKSVGKIFGKQWEIKRQSIWNGSLGIYQYGDEMPSAVYARKLFGKGLLKLDKGVVLYFDYKIWKGIMEITNESGKVLISTKSKSGFKLKTMINILQKSELLDARPWIILLISYLEIKRQRSRNSG